MSLGSLQFLLPLLLVAAVFFYLPGRRWRQGVLAGFNVAFLYLLVPNDTSWAALAVFLMSGYGVARLLSKWPSRVLLWTYLVVLIGAFAIIRKYDLVMALLPASMLTYAVSIIGISYMLFRQIQFLVDTMQGQVEHLSLWTYANYQLNLFTLLSGPIQRYQEFRQQWHELAPALEDGHAARTAYLRLLIGVLKMTVLATAFLSLYQHSAGVLMAAAGSGSRLQRSVAIEHFLGILYFYPLYLYLNFSGYCDIVIAGARFVGLRLPENFDRPYLSRNLIDYWTRWHRTLGFWIRDYLFVPLYKAIAVRRLKRAESLAFLCYFVAFFVAGVWHGSTANFVVYGLFQGVGVSAAKLWERHLLKRRGRGGLREYLESPRVRAAAIAGTLHFACFSLLFFPVDINTTLQIFRTVWSAVV